VDKTYASQYRLRLIAADMIHSTGRGFVDFSLPYLRDYLREHAAAADLGASGGCTRPGVVKNKVAGFDLLCRCRSGADCRKNQGAACMQCEGRR